MNHKESSFKIADNATIYCQSWLPDAPAKAMIILVHGLGEHSGRYMNLVNDLVPRGYAIHGLDHIGHGKSDGRRRYIDSFEEYITTLHTFSGLIRNEHPETPVFLLGHSMGGLIAARYLLDYQNEFNGAIISAPAIKAPDSVTSLTIFVGKILSVIFPKMGLLPINPQAISRDPEVVRAYIEDPLVCKNRTPARLAAEILKTMHYVVDHAGRINLPMIILQGMSDKVIDPGGAKLLHESVASRDKTLKLYDELYHEVLNAPEHEVVLGDIRHWLEPQLAT